MWSNYFVQPDDDGRIGVAGVAQGGGLGGMKGGRVQRRSQKISDSLEGKIKLAFFVAIVGVTLTVLGVGTEFWVELAQSKNFSGNQTCQMAHYGLWKGCIHTLWVADIDPERTSCGPAELPGGETSDPSVCVVFCLCSLEDEQVMFPGGEGGGICLLCPCDCPLVLCFPANCERPGHARPPGGCFHVTVHASVGKGINRKGSKYVCGW